MKTFQNDIVNHRTADVASVKVLEINTDDIVFIESKKARYAETTTPSPTVPDDDRVILCNNGKTIEKIIDILDIYRTIDTVGGTNPNSVLAVKLPFDTTDFPRPWITDTSDTVKTITSTGVYLLNYFVEAEKQTSSTVDLEFDVELNGILTGTFSSIGELGGNRFNSFQSITDVINLDSGDTLSVVGLRVSGNAGVCSIVPDSTRFVLKRVA